MSAHWEKRRRAFQGSPSVPLASLSIEARRFDRCPSPGLGYCPQRLASLMTTLDGGGLSRPVFPLPMGVPRMAKED